MNAFEKIFSIFNIALLLERHFRYSMYQDFWLGARLSSKLMNRALLKILTSIFAIFQICRELQLLT